MPSPVDLGQVAQDLLDAATAALDTIPTYDPSLAGAPERRFVSAGPPVWDCCEQLVVHAAGVAQEFTRPSSPPAATGQRHRYGAWLWKASLTLTVGRCVPEGELLANGKYVPPDVAALDAAAAQINADGWALVNGIANRLFAGQLHDRCSGWQWDALNSVDPAGGCGGWTINFRVTIDGYGLDEVMGT